ncbi:YbaB/EbfC family nucleoid-associated protein [Paractinoplanes globisporus]|uniref:YbaB/EbfC family nucleoid-associated protein n=1 Tax=Paractinoplanes globisporus TaxID=113565 RepID=A0ABW6WDZ5_9ACTN|nr:YbaB/EbfC family nucleoid-associated protein [Actinoplanes globisporus]
MFDGRDFEAAERMIDDWQADIEARAARARELSTRLSRLSARVRSQDELVTVTVGSAGDLTGLELDERIRRRPAAETARLIMATLQAARERLTADVAEVTAQTVGADSATGRAVIASYAGRWGARDV